MIAKCWHAIVQYYTKTLTLKPRQYCFITYLVKYPPWRQSNLTSSMDKIRKMPLHGLNQLVEKLGLNLRTPTGVQGGS